MSNVKLVVVLLALAGVGGDGGGVGVLVWRCVVMICVLCGECCQMVRAGRQWCEWWQCRQAAPGSSQASTILTLPVSSGHHHWSYTQSDPPTHVTLNSITQTTPQHSLALPGTSPEQGQYWGGRGWVLGGVGLVTPRSGGHVYYTHLVIVLLDQTNGTRS